MHRLTPLRFENPRRWQLKTQGLQGGSLEWCADEDRHFLCWQGVVGRAAAVSDEVEAPSGRRLVVAWLTRFNGRQYRLSERQRRDPRLASFADQNIRHHWNDLTDFVGVRLRFFDAAGVEVQREDWRTRCLQTEDWQQAWRCVSSPPDAERLALEFAFESEAVTDGSWCVRDVEVWDVEAEEALPEGMGELTVRLQDPRGEPLLARCQVRREEEAFAPLFTETYEHHGLWFCPSFPEFRLVLPPGEYEITALRGFETAPARRAQVSVRAGCRHVEVIELHRPPLLDVWRQPCGEEHVHLYFHRHTHFPHLTPEDVFRLARTEGLDYLAFQAELFELLEAEGEMRQADEHGFVADVSMEVVTDFWGHLATVNHGRISERYPLGPWLAPLNPGLGAFLEESGAAAVYCHPYGEMDEGEAILEVIADGRRMGVARSLPIDVALGRSVGIELLYGIHTDGFLQKLRDLYRLWSLGFRVAPAAASDLYLDQSRLPLGTVRTYLFHPFVPERNGQAIAEAYRQAATLATNGPLLELRVQGFWPGARVGVASGETVEAEVWAFSLWGLEGVEVLCNGDVVQCLRPQADGVVRGTVALIPDSSGWVAARALGPIAPEINAIPVGPYRYQQLPSRNANAPWNDQALVGQFAQTGPVFVWLDDQPLPVARQQADYFLEWLDAVSQAVEARADLLQATCQRYPEWTPEGLTAHIREHLEAAHRVYRERRERGAAPPPG